MDLGTHLAIGGTGLVILGLAHTGFSRYFGWREDFAKLTLFNRNMAAVHAAFIAFTCVLMGLLMISSAEELRTTPLGHRVAWGLVAFWGFRLVTQLFWYPAALWRGRRFETTVHVVFTAYWIYLVVILTLTALGR
ncbi:MAG: hypothetical protein R3F20_06270 [Planctomycetota bacterium]